MLRGRLKKKQDIEEDLPETDACPSVLAINDRHNNLHMSFSFQPTTVEHVAEKLHQLNSKKATGFDHIPAKLLKVSADIIAPSLTAQINNNIATSCFPTELKTAQLGHTCLQKERSP